MPVGSRFNVTVPLEGLTVSFARLPMGVTPPPKGLEPPLPPPLAPGPCCTLAQPTELAAITRLTTAAASRGNTQACLDRGWELMRKLQVLGQKDPEFLAPYCHFLGSMGWVDASLQKGRRHYKRQRAE